MTITVTTAVKLSADQKKKLTTALKKKYDSVDLNEVVSDKVGGGIKLTLGSKQIDNTVRAKLTQIRTKLLNIEN